MCPCPTSGVRWLSEEEQVSWRAYLRANRELDVALDHDLQVAGISLSEYELLSMLSEAPMGQLRMSALAALIVQSRSRVTHTAARLERRGWVKRTPAPDDGRGVLLRLTDDGRGRHRPVRRSSTSAACVATSSTSSPRSSSPPWARRCRRSATPTPRRHHARPVG